MLFHRPREKQNGANGSAPTRPAFDPSAILNNIRDAVFIIEADGTIAFCNGSANETFKQNDTSLLDFHSLLAAHEARQFDEKLNQLLANDTETFAFYFNKDEPTLRKRCFELLASRFAPGIDDAQLIVLTVREIERGGHGVQYLNVGYERKIYWKWRNDFKTRATSWPPEMCAVAGISPQEGAHMSADQVRALLHPRDRYVLRDVYKNAHDTTAPSVFYSRIKSASGGYTHCLTHGFVERDERGNPLGFVGFSCDITKEIEADQMLRESETQLRELVEQISDLVILRDGDGRMLYVSPAARRVLGREPASMVGTRIADTVHPDDLPSYTQSYNALPTDGENYTITFRIRHGDGHYVWLESNIRCLAVRPDGRPARLASISRDVTERKQAAENLAAARERAEAASATKSRFLANMSHELRTPLNAIIGFSDIIHRELFGPVGNAQYKDYARLIQDSGAHLLDLINDVLDMSKIEAGKFDLRLEELDIEDVVRTCMTLMEPHAQRSKLMLTAKLGQPHRVVRADRRAVKQILLNLITNAIKFTPTGGLVTVSVENLMDGVALQVSDTGVGIPPEDIERVTQPFEQVTSDPLLAQSGSGLGLALVQSLVGMHMGKLKIDSVQGQGTVVSVFLPFDPRTRRAA